MRSLISYFLFMSVFAYPVVTQAETNLIGLGEESIHLELGYYLPSFNTKVRLDSKTLGIGDEVDMEDDIGYDRNLGIARLNGHYRVASRHRVLFGYYAFKRSSTRVLDEELQIGDEIYPINTTINSNTDVSIYDLNYMYSLLKTSKYEASIGLGLHIIDWDFDLSESGGGQATDSNFTAPLPLLGLDFNYAINHEFRVGVLTQIFTLEIDDYRGNFTNLRGKLEYYPFKNFGFGLGIDAFNLDISADSTELQGRLRWSYTGAQVYTNIRF